MTVKTIRPYMIRLNVSNYSYWHDGGGEGVTTEWRERRHLAIGPRWPMGAHAVSTNE